MTDPAMSIDMTNAIGSATAGGNAQPRTPRQRELRKAVDELVGTVFFGEVFQAVRASRLKGPYGHGGRGEEVFAAQLHDVLAKRMGRSSRMGLNDAIYRRFAPLV